MFYTEFMSLSMNASMHVVKAFISCFFTFWHKFILLKSQVLVLRNLSTVQ